jgi:hypothetical protein
MTVKASDRSTIRRMWISLNSGHGNHLVVHREHVLPVSAQGPTDQPPAWWGRRGRLVIIKTIRAVKNVTSPHELTGELHATWGMPLPRDGGHPARAPSPVRSPVAARQTTKAMAKAQSATTLAST